MDYVKQCRLERKIETGTRVTYSWIDAKKAFVGNTIQLKQRDGTWSDPWTVVSASSDKMPYDEANERSRDYTRTRKASDV